VGGREEGPGRSGRRAESKSAVAVERSGPGTPGNKPIPGFAALEVLPDAAAATLEAFLKGKALPGSHILSDGRNGYKRLEKIGFEHTATVISGQDEAARSLFPWVHMDLSNLKLFLLGTHHKVEPKYLKRYMAEFNCRLNLRSMEPTMPPKPIRACLATQTIACKQLVVTPELS